MASSGKDDTKCPLSISTARWLLPVFALAILFYGLPLIQGEYFAERARIALRDYKLVEGFDFARKGIEAEKHNPDLYYYAGEAAREMSHQKIGDSQTLGNEAIYYFNQGLEAFPYDSRLAVKLGQAYSNMGDYFEAANAISLAEEWDPNSSFVFAYRGLIEFEGGYLDDAEDAYRQAIELGGEGSHLAQEGLAIVLKNQEKEAEAPPSPEALEAAKQLTEKLGELQEEQTPSDPNEFDPSKIKDLNELNKLYK